MPLIGGALIRRPSMFLRSQKGQGLAEYALILALIAILAILALGVLSGAINGVLTKVGASI
jgi:Flp pilus assembly pilin Flp